jgi:hypothetical protein
MPPDARGVYLQARDIRELAESYEFSPHKSKGQNFVGDANTVRKIVHLSGVGEGDHVVEVGPGFGSLTLGLLDAGAVVTAIEIDPRLARATTDVVAARLPGAQLDVLCADALGVSTLPAPADYLVANLPYNVAVPVVIHLLSLHPGFRRVLVMVQAEVGWRIAAKPDTTHYGSPSVKRAFLAKCFGPSRGSIRYLWACTPTLRWAMKPPAGGFSDSSMRAFAPGAKCRAKPSPSNWVGSTTPLWPSNPRA